MTAEKSAEKRDFRAERIKYRRDIRDFVRADLGFLGTQKLFDAGCGTGLVSREIKKRYGGVKVVGLDCSRKDIGEAKRKARRARLAISYHVGDLQRIPFKDGTFDVVVGTIVLHHLSPEGKAKALGEFHRIMREGGNLVILEGRSLSRGLAKLISDAGFSRISKNPAGEIRFVYSAVKKG
jgi:ubiquinone/menaquinone biosynthesis C-methylase UbiE